MRFALVALVVAIGCGEVAPPANSAGQSVGPIVVGNAIAPTNMLDAPPPTEADATVPIEDDDAVWGSRLAPVTIVEFSDFQCPFCGRAELTVDALKAEYGKEQLRVVYKHEPLSFHPNAKPAAEAAAAIRALGGDEAFWRFHSIAFHNQEKLSPAAYEDWAQRSGVNLQAFREATISGRFADVIGRDQKAGEKLSVNGTPAFFINGIGLTGSQPIEKFHEVIADAQKSARAAMEKGARRETLYKIVSAANFKPTADDEQPAPDTAVWRVPVGNSPVQGPATALVTIVVFSDFQCPYCSKVEPTLAQLRAQYGDKLRIVWKNEPLSFHDHAVPAAMLALEARAEKGDAGFWSAHDKLFAQQDKQTDADLFALGASMGLDATKLRLAISQKKYQSVLDADGDLGDDVNANGTPHFFINGRRLAGAQPLLAFQAMIDAELNTAQALIAAGTAPASVYDEIMKNGKAPPSPQKIAATLPTGGPVRGVAAAPITIVEFSDLECPYCKRVEPTLSDLMKTYGNKVKVEWHDLPLSFHPHAHLAAEASRAVLKLKGKDAFFKFHEAVFALQGGAGLERAELESAAFKLGVDMTKFKAALDQHTYASEVDADSAAATTAGFTGTPAFVINGYAISGAQPYAKFRRTIDLALSEVGKKP